MKNGGFVRREWLNPDDHSSTGSVVAFHGDAHWMHEDGKRGEVTFLEIADCRCKVKLHRAELDTTEDFIGKMEKLREVIDEFVYHLRSA